MSGPVSPLRLDRYELKYLIPLSMVEPISKYVEMFCEMDYYSKISHDHFYTINSLYFETPTFHFIRMKENMTGRYSARVRSYGDAPKAPYFFEIKEKANDFCKKTRGAVPVENWSELITDPSIRPTFNAHKDVNIQNFLYIINTYGAVPTILTQYRRKAYLSTVDVYARVTFDRSMRYCEERNFNVHPVDSSMNLYDHDATFGEPGVNVVLELKCERKIPVWMVDLIKRFDLVRGGFSKFDNSMRECFSIDGQEEFAHGRISMY